MNRKRILVVDDEPVARRLIGLMLGAAYEVVAAASGHEALELLEVDAYDLMITDGTMPGMLGMDLIERVQARLPGMPCLMVSGNIDDQRREWLDARGVPFVHKPYRAVELHQAVKDALPT